MSTASAMRRRAAAAGELDDFEAARIEPGEFHHEDHVRIAWLYLRDHGLLESIRRYSQGLRRLTKKFGVAAKYHETITWFFLMQVAERIEAGDAADWDAFRARNPDLFGGWSELLGRYYTQARIESAAARRSFLLPDRLI